MLTANNILDALDEFIAEWRTDRYRSGADMYESNSILLRFEALSEKLHAVNDAQKSIWEDDISEKVKRGELSPHPIRTFTKNDYEIHMMAYKYEEKSNEK